MKIETQCPRCHGPMTLECDESAGQEIIDRMARMISCRKCNPEPPLKAAPPKPKIINVGRKPYAD